MDFIYKRDGITDGQTDGRTDGQTDGRTDRRTDDPNTICPRRTFQAGGIKKGEKRKNKENNESGESQSKVQVTSSQSVVESIPRMSTNGNVCSPGPLGLYNNQSTPIAGYPIPPNAYMPQGPQSNFAGYISPIQDVNGRFDNLASKLDHVCAKLEKLDSIEKRLTSLEASLVTVNDDMRQVKQQTQDMENSMTLINDQFEEHKSDLTGLQNTVPNVNNGLQGGQ